MENSTTPFFIPNSLRKKNVSSQISREIFFIDCMNDLDSCAKSGISYHLIRSSVLLRMLLLDNGLETISKNYNFNLELMATENELPGNPLFKSQVRAIKETLIEFKNAVSSTKALKLIYKPFKKHSLDNFNDKICLTIKGKEEYNFSVRNIIEIVANKNGAAHLESTFDSTGIESFHLDDYSPFSMTDGNFYLETIKEIILILVEAVNPLSKEIIKHLINCDNSISQTEVSTVATLVNL